MIPFSFYLNYNLHKNKHNLPMIKINLKDVITLKNKEFDSNIKIIPTYLIEELEKMDLPISNRNIAIKNICDFLTLLNTRYNEYGSSVIPIDKDVFIRFFNNRLYTEYKNILDDLKVITKVPYEDGSFYSKDEGKSLQYRIHNKYLLTDDYTLLFFKRGRNIKKNIRIECNVNSIMLDTILNEELDYKRVFKEELDYHRDNNTSKFSLYIRISRALSMNNDRYIKQGNNVDRIFHSFSNLSKVTRKCFYTEFFEVDLVNAQPMLLALHLNKEDIKYEDSYRLICEEGRFYELFFEGDNDKLRDEIKVQCYSSIFFDFKENMEVNKKFKVLFPMLWEYLKSIKKNKITMASILQNEEANIFNNIKVRNSSKFYTLFDAVMFNNIKDKGYIKSQIEDYGLKYNLKLKVK